MNWSVDLSRDAQKELEDLPKDVRKRVERAIDEMEVDPFGSNVKALKGPEWKGRYRKRVGHYRIIFMPNHEEKTVGISAILIRSKKTYR
jgi:mRNA-degrading endonuclease RelE of RelBE toxin-antitoxin system